MGNTSLLLVPVRLIIGRWISVPYPDYIPGDLLWRSSRGALKCQWTAAMSTGVSQMATQTATRSTKAVTAQPPGQGWRRCVGVGSMLWLLLFGGIFLAGCGRNQAPSPDAGPQLLNTLPSDWTPVTLVEGGLLRDPTVWQAINVDDDAGAEYLLFFTYDSGQIGALIYDQQTGENQVTSRVPLMAPNQPAGTFIPYRLEPNYWPGAGAASATSHRPEPQPRRFRCWRYSAVRRCQHPPRAPIAEQTRPATTNW